MATKKGDTPVEGENDWFFDIIINFLRSPRWKAPIMSFLDEYCIIFDNEEENRLEYTPIHCQFKKLVEDLIGELIAELGVTQEIFMEACGKAESNPIHKKIVDQIIAVDNFVAFKKLMCKRNAELNKQAISMMQAKEESKEESKESAAGKPKKAAAPEKKMTPEELIKEQQANVKGKKLDKEMQEALKIAQELERQEEDEMMRKALEESQKMEEESKSRHKEVEDEEMKMIQ